MILDDVLKNPTLRRVLAAGEEGVGRVVGRLLSSEAIHAGLRGLASSARQARETIERGVERTLHAVNLPSRDDVAALQRKLDELESMIDGLAARAGTPRPPGGSASPDHDDEDPSVPPDV
jgi:hypothetical protein